MNKSKLKEIKEIMGYKGFAEQKRLLRRFKKSYSSLNEEDKIKVIEDLKEAFEIKSKNTWFFNLNIYYKNMHKLKYFSAPWCGPCKFFKPIINELKEDGYDIEIINIDEDQEKTLAYGVQSVPHLVFESKCSEKSSDCKEEILYRVSGGASKSDIEKILTTKIK